MALQRSRALLTLALGVFIFMVCATAQISSVLTPVLSRFPTLLNTFGDIGILLLAIAAVVSLALSIRNNSRTLYLISLLYLVLAVVSQVTLLGQVFQLSIAGLTVGGSLLILGSRQFLSLKRRP